MAVARVLTSVGKSLTSVPDESRLSAPEGRGTGPPFSALTVSASNHGRDVGLIKYVGESIGFRMLNGCM